MRMRRALLPLPFLISFSLATNSFSQNSVKPEAVNSTYRGDINEDGKINIFDLLELLKVLSSPSSKTEREIQIADIDANGVVNISNKVHKSKSEFPLMYLGYKITFITATMTLE